MPWCSPRFFSSNPRLGLVVATTSGGMRRSRYLSMPVPALCDVGTPRAWAANREHPTHNRNSGPSLLFEQFVWFVGAWWHPDGLGYPLWAAGRHRRIHRPTVRGLDDLGYVANRCAMRRGGHVRRDRPAILLLVCPGAVRSLGGTPSGARWPTAASPSLAGPPPLPLLRRCRPRLTRRPPRPPRPSRRPDGVLSFR